MDTNERLRLLLSATPENIEAIDKVLEGKAEPTKPSFRLWRMCEVSRETGLSRTLIWRAISEGRLKATSIRKGSRRIHEEELRRFVEGK